MMILFICAIIILVSSSILVQAVQSAQFMYKKIGMGELFENFLIRIGDYKTENIAINQLASIPEVFYKEISTTSRFSFIVDYRYYKMLYEAARFATENFENEKLMTMIQLYATTNIEINDATLESTGIILWDNFMAKCQDFNILVKLSSKGIERKDEVLWVNQNS